MAYHTANGQVFIGMRKGRGIGRQIVYDALPNKRVLFDILDPAMQDSTIQEALREGIKAKDALSGLIAALQARAIHVDALS